MEENYLISYYETINEYYLLMSIQQPCMVVLYNKNKPMVVKYSSVFDLGIRENGTIPSLAQECLRTGKPSHKIFTKEESMLQSAYSATVFPIVKNNVIIGALGLYKPAFEEIKESFRQLATNIMEIRGFSENSAKVAMNSAHENEKLMENLQRLSGQAEEIKKLNEWIANFSAQTNLLGLNAAIEAARAGEFGKGFGIVADEIRKLSLEVKQSSLAIAGQLTNMNNVANEALSLMQNLYSRTEEQAAMSQELASTVNSINQASSILSESVEKVL